MRRATSPRPPKYCHHKATGRAYVTVNGKEVYLGPYGSQESKDAYARLLARQGVPEPAGSDAPLTVDQVVAGFWLHAKKVYPAPPVPEKKRPTGELGNYWDALRPLCRLYGSMPAVRFGPLALETVQEEMIRVGWCRNRINRNTSRLKAVFRWAVRRELLPGEVLYRLEAVEGLKVGRTSARESAEIKPVPDEYVQAVLPLVSRQMKAMIELQLLTGMRPGEACSMRTRDLDTAGKVWFYRPPKHKTAHHGHLREIRIGPRGQEILAPFLKPDLEAFVFTPADAETERARARRARRKSPVRAWEHRQDRAGVEVAGGRKRAPKDRYTVATYRKAIVRACRRADRLAHEQDPTLEPEVVAVPAWHPNQLRHNAATWIRRDHGLDVAQVILGHKDRRSTQVYAEPALAAADEVIVKIG